MKISAVTLRRLLCVVAVISALLALPNGVLSQTGTVVEFPASSYVLTCQSSRISVSIANVTDLTAYHLEIDFVPGDVLVTAVENGGFIPNGIPEETNATDNTAGSIVFGMARQDYNTQPVDGSGVLIYISVQAVNPGATVNFNIRPYVPGTEPTNGTGSMLVGWPDVMPIPFSTTNGTVYTQSCTATDIQLSNNQINENSPVGSAVGTFTTINPNNETDFTYTLESTDDYPDNVFFTTNGNELRTNAIFNFENVTSYLIKVRSTSSLSGQWIERTFTITITDVNDPPVLGAIGARSVDELAPFPLTFTATASDADTLPAPDTLTYSLGLGAPSGAAIDADSGAFSWTPTEAQGPMVSVFDVCVRDGTASACETITVTVNEVNAAPSGANKIVTTLEDTGKIFAATDFPLTDPNDLPANTLAAIRIASLPSVGTLKVNSVNALVNQNVTLVQLNAGALVYTPAFNGNGTGYTSFNFQVQDNGGGANALDPTANTMTINVTSVNDAPAGMDKTVTIPEDSSKTFASSDFGFSDVNDVPQNTFSAVKITTLPAKGSLKLNGVAVTAGLSVLVASIPQLVFAPAANGNGTPYSSFTFQVQDNGGTANGGVALDSTPNTMTINVTPVNDPPVGVADFYYLNSTMFYDIIKDPNNAKDTYQLIAGSNTDTPGVLQNDSDVDLDVLSVSLKTGVAKGTLVLNSNGSFTYTPNQSLLQDTDSFVYTLSDGHGGSKDVTVNITIDRIPPSPVAQWLEPVTALAGSSVYKGTTYENSTETIALKVFVDDTSDVAKVEFKWYDHTQTPGVWHIIGTDNTPTLESGKNVYTSSFDLTPLPYIDQIQVWAYTYDAAGNYNRMDEVDEGYTYDYWSRFLLNHNPSGYNVFLPFIRR